MADEVDALKRELARVTEERDRLQNQLLHPHRMEVAGTLAAGLAHDMNNVLAAISSIAEVLLDEPREPEVRNDLEQIVAQAERGAALTRSLLAFSRKGQYRRAIGSVDEIVRNVVALLGHTLPKLVIVRDQLGCGAACVDGDAVQLGQVLINLCLNAADAMAGKGTLILTSQVVELDPAAAGALGVAPAKYAQVAVRDDGCGMDEDTRRRAFEPFFTTKPQGKGTGLGLALVWGVVSAHDGAVAIESKLQVGTTVSIYLPISTAAPARAPAPVQARALPTDTTILVVDDEPAVRSGTTRILERLGYSVLGASDGAEALRVFEAHENAIGLVVLDMKMPVMDGAECFRRLRKQSAVPVLLATGYAIDEDVQKLVAHGAALIEKPFSASSLTVEVTRVLQQNPRRRRLTY